MDSPTLHSSTSRANALVLAFLVIALHAYFLWIFGATFWFDSMDYVNLGNEVVLPHSGPRFFYLQHQGVGEGFLWMQCVELLGERAWLGLAIVQHGLSVLATLWFCLTLSSTESLPVRLGMPGAYLAALLLTCHPFLRAFDNSIMTESVAGSMLLLCLGAGIRLLDGQGRSNVAILVLAAVVGTQFRSYLAPIAVGLLVCVWLFREVGRAPLRSTLGLGVRTSSIALGALAFPVLRWLGTGFFFLPNFAFWSVPVAIENNPGLAADFFTGIEADLPSEMTASRLEKLTTKPMNIYDWAQIAQEMMNRGAGLDETSRSFSQLASALRTESTDTIVNQLALPGMALGFTRYDLLFSPDYRIRRAFDVRGLAQFNDFHYRWLSWTISPDHSPWFRDYMKRYRQRPAYFPPAHLDQYESVAPYLKVSGVRRKDPLGLVNVPPDVWLLAATLGLLVLLYRSPCVACLLAVPAVVSYFIMLACGIGGIRYFHLMMLVYLPLTAYFVVALCEWILSGIDEVVGLGFRGKYKLSGL